MRTVLSHFSVITADAPGDRYKQKWNKQVLHGLRGKMKELKRTLVMKSAANFDSVLYTVEYHSVDRMLENLRKFRRPFH